MKNFILSIVLGISVFASANASDIITLKKGDINLVGHVVSGGEHVPFVTIVIKGTNVGVATDETGHYMIPKLPQGEFTLVAQAVGYQKQEKQIELSSDKMYELNFDLMEDLIGLEEVVVSADRNEMNRKEAPVIITPITSKLLTRSAAPVLAEGLSFSPGVRLEKNCGNCGFTQVRLNGLEGPYTQILINSRPVFSAVAGVYGLEQIPANMIQRVEVVRGGGSALFGGSAIAGTINIITKDPVSNSFAISSQYNAIGVGVNGSDEIANDIVVDFNGSVVSENGNNGLFVFGMKRERDPWDANKDGFSEITKQKNTSVGFRAFHRFSPKSKLDFEYFTLAEDRRGGNMFDYVQHEADIAEWVKHNINSGSLAWDYYLNRETNTKLSVYSSAQHLLRDSYYGAEKDPSSYGNTKDLAIASGVQLSGETNKLLFGTSRYVLGFENNYASLVDKKLGYLDTATAKHIPNSMVADQKSVTNGFFAQNQWSFSKAKLVLGLRIDNYEITDNEHGGANSSETVLIPRASFMYDFNDHIQSRISYGKGYRAPQIFSEDLHIESSGARKILHKIDANLKQEVSNSFTGSLDINGKLGNGQFSLLFEGFYTKLDNPFATRFSDPNEKGEITSTRYNEVGAVVKGLNTEFKYSPNAKIQVQTGFTLQSSKYDDPIAWGTDDAVKSAKFMRSPNQYGFVTFNWNITHNWEVSANGTYTGNMYVPHLGLWTSKTVGGETVDVADLNHEDVKAGKVIAGDELVKTDPFFDLGLKLSYHRHISKTNEIEFFGGVRNLFNSYQSDFDTGINRDAGWTYGPINPRTIYFGVKIGNLGK